MTTDLRSTAVEESTVPSEDLAPDGAGEAARRTASPDPARRLDAEGLVLRYGRSEVVHGVDLQIRPGEVTVLLGPNGSGKSTVLRAVSRLHPLTQGEVRIAERDAALMGAKDFARTLTLFSQSRGTPQGLTVREVVGFGRHPHRRRFAGLSDVDEAAIERAMELTGTTAFAARGVGELSGGEIQRVWLASCLAQDTGIVLLDEPTNHLDLRFQIETLDLVRDLAAEHGAAIGVVLHDLGQATRIADRVVLLRRGDVHAAGTVDEVLTSQHLSEVYDIPIETSTDPASGRRRIEVAERRPRAR
ncbi:ABC transporter ATP-binding protein [Brachybacterium sp. MASK1Z-5]|uniref:ABC transporter ATP-binding protein n=1 Tax=Brachybacterium halotolerans TaxID=2795215 RepID=A0ABS1BB05_9MICO|nr:ABC transporter ATP-binding protein [Brachybacterium halotolerans]MBK0331815.1 ABC transporter ATP-binding protein [Brachybacterium halotolerans]